MSPLYTDHTVSRPLAPNERFQVSASNVGHPATLAFLATLPTTTTTLTQQSILTAIDVLLSLYPLLACGIVDGRTKKPSWEVRLGLDASRVFVVREESSALASDEALLEELTNLGSTFDGTRGPLWKVILWEGKTECRLGLSIAHVLSDGIGARNLFCDLLRILRGPPIERPERAWKGSLAPTWHSRAKIALKLSVVLVLLWEMFRDQLKASRKRVERLVPGEGFDRSPSRCAIVRVADVGALKMFAKEHKIGTLHPLLKGALLTAAFLANEDGLEEGVVSAMTPFSFRDTTPALPRVAGNYSAPTYGTFILRHDQSFIELCRAYSALVSDPKTKRRAMERADVCEMLPSPRKGSTFALDGKSYPLGAKEKLLLDLAESKRSYRMDIGTSNLMTMESTGWEDEPGFRVCAAKNAGVAYARLVVTVVSDVRGRMAIVVSWQEPSLEKDEYAMRFVKGLRVILGRVDEGSVDARTTLEEFRG